MERPGHHVVRGWVQYVDYGTCVGLTHHSVLQDNGSALFDITPIADERLRRLMRFVRHPGGESLFQAMKSLCEIRCPYKSGAKAGQWSSALR
jgi:hypothetical protein